MRRGLLSMGIAVLIFSLNITTASATSIWLSPSDQVFDIGDILTYNLYADIDPSDEIIGFGFDLSFDGGLTFITGPGDSGSALTFASFIPNASYFTFDPVYTSDSDTISGFLHDALFDPPVSGANILLGTFQFDAFALNPESIFISASDIGTATSVEGLVPGAWGSVSFLPNTTSADASPVPEPATLVLLGSGLAGMVCYFKRKKRLGEPNFKL